MKRNKFFIAVALCVSGLCFHSCLEHDTPTDDFRTTDIKLDDIDVMGSLDSVNTIKYTAEFTEAQVDAATQKLSAYLGMFKSAQYYMRGGKTAGYPGPHAYQLQYTLSDVYAQYAVVPHQDFLFATLLRSSYNVSETWNNGANGQYSAVRTSLVPILNHAAVDTIPEIKALALLLFNYASIEAADLYGPIAYNDFKVNKLDPPFEYNDLKTIYTEAEANIKTIVACLRHFENKPAWYKNKIQNILQSYDAITQDQKNGITNLESWIRFANSLKLRMAMHIVKVEPGLAKQWAEEAVAGGVIDDVKYQVALYPAVYGGTHPLVTISNVWGDTRASASLVSLLKSLEHPYARILFKANSGDLYSGTTVNLPSETDVIGIRSGVHTGKGQAYASNQFVGFSRFDSEIIQHAPLYFFKMAEVDFLRAEGALRGWNMGNTPEFFYNRGIENSLLFSPGTDIAEGMKEVMTTIYREKEQPTDYLYVDPTGSSPSIQSVTKIGVKWNDGDDREIKLEKIITQKYLALYPNSMEAWGEMRRTGYPKMFPVLNVEDGDGSLKAGDLVRRMLFPNNDDAALKDIQATGLKALGGTDQQATRLWWDVNKANF